MENPKLIPVPFAKNGDKNTIPEKFNSTLEANKATWETGFARITMIPAPAGGMPPLGQDFNGILYDISDNLVYASKGGKYKFSEEYAATIGGYPKGAILQSDDETKEYQSLLDNNEVNFNTASSDDVGKSWKLIFTTDMLSAIDGKQPSGNYATKTELKDVENKIPSLMTEDELKNGTSKTARSVNAALLKELADSVQQEFATDEETVQGVILDKAVTPAGLASLKASTTNRGIVQLATSTEFWGGTNDTKATTPLSIVSAFKEHSVFSNSGYQILPGGLIIQWVRLEKKVGSYAGTYNFPITFPNACFGVNIGNSFWNGPNGWQTRAAPINNSTYQVREDVYINNGAGNESQAFMMAIGY